MGVWVVDTSRLPLPPEAWPKRVTITFADEGAGRWRTQVEVVAPTGALLMAEGVTPLDGSATQVPSNFEADVSATFMPRPEVLVMQLGKGGMPASSRVYTVAPDGTQIGASGRFPQTCGVDSPRGTYRLPDPPLAAPTIATAAARFKMSAEPSPVDAYIAGFPRDIQVLLGAVRTTVLAAVPQGEERISYRMPAVFSSGVVVYYAAFKNHIGLYPPVADPAVRAKVARYAGPKGNLQFPYGEPLPLELIAEVAKARLAANLAKNAPKGIKRPTRADEDHA